MLNVKSFPKFSAGNNSPALIVTAGLIACVALVTIYFSSNAPTGADIDALVRDGVSDARASGGALPSFDPLPDMDKSGGTAFVLGQLDQGMIWNGNAWMPCLSIVSIDGYPRGSAYFGDAGSEATLTWNRVERSTRYLLADACTAGGV